MGPTKGKSKLRDQISGRLAGRYPIRLALGMVVGTVILSGTAVYLGPNHFQEEHGSVPGSTATNELTGNAFRLREEQRAADREDDLRDMTQYWNQLEAEESAPGSNTTVPSTNIWPFAGHKDEPADTAPHRYDAQIEQLEQRLEALLAEASRDPSKNTRLYYREIERLDDQIDVLRLNAMRDASEVGASSNELTGNIFRIREVQRAADRQDDLQDMSRYWNQLKQSATNGTLWVTNRPLNNVTVFDSGTGDVLGTVPVGGGPIGITAPPGTGKVYVSNDTPDTVSVIDKSSLSVVATIPMGERPHHLTHSPNGKFVYVAEFGANTIGVIDTDSDTVVAHYTAGTAAARTHAVWVTRDGKTLYVTNSVEDTIAALDAQTGALLWSLPVGGNPSEILVTPNGKTAYVTVRGEDKVKVVDVTVPEIVGEVVVGVQPDTLQLTPDLKTLVVALRGTPAEVALVDIGTLAVTPVAIDPGTTTGHHWLSANGRYTFVAVEDPGSIAVIDNSAATVESIYPYPESGKPHGVFHEPSQLK